MEQRIQATSGSASSLSLSSTLFSPFRSIGREKPDKADKDTVWRLIGNASQCVHPPSRELDFNFLNADEGERLPTRRDNRWRRARRGETREKDIRRDRRWTGTWNAK